MKKITFLFCFILSYGMAQNDLRFSHYMYNENIFNPAATGNSNKSVASLVARQQWMGIDNPPSTQFLNAHTYLGKIKGGIGLAIINDRVGYENTLNFKVNYAYHLRISKSSVISAGVSAGFVNKKLDGTKLIYENEVDPSAVITNTTVFSPDFGAGLEFKASGLTAGISSTHLSNSTKRSTVFLNPRHYFLYTKYKIKLNKEYSVTPSVLVKNSKPITQIELSTIAAYKEKISLGLTYRIKEAIVGLVGITITDVFFIGYSYDFNTKTLASQSSGSHEIMLQVKLKGIGKFNAFTTEKY